MIDPASVIYAGPEGRVARFHDNGVAYFMAYTNAGKSLRCPTPGSARHWLKRRHAHALAAAHVWRRIGGDHESGG